MGLLAYCSARPQGPAVNVTCVPSGRHTCNNGQLRRRGPPGKASCQVAIKPSSFNALLSLPGLVGFEEMWWFFEKKRGQASGAPNEALSSLLICSENSRSAAEQQPEDWPSGFSIGWSWVQRFFTGRPLWR